ncbi:3-oxoacyl-[acyl-carrier-protein] reductase [Gluconacetobacter sp. SXCC-1]|uniref:SDR family oxidoreductase n=1 Tax=Komagataeibacter rhaeticus TaxID=215221 RepID=UPI000208098A|nr:SDR family oxidoreductase [Komagataeibacter rhaeticus]ATU72845.1 short-chain dehydrogenase [Komagataeibacter xylinus]EGG76739.1 3-oxoacyl-[acyl-carrier-protein] reductase [Gluconacetobacter sp. SXCC-1]WPP22628.1 SDR family oxidoreductase [Komagataeibacter rhaeticus]SAY46819.1 3-oxoacyl-[acyl-carrier-protein] reductase FabG [Komagataeibacter rhaeticus]SAY50032.1 3-oxoacyl-[acyl-carrier-protein] reductase FabG [Komagataeibacter rhaeticus]
MDLKLAGKSALITGASKGIGLSAARVLAAEGCTRLHLAARNGEALNAARQELEAQYDVAVHVHPMDLGAAGSMEVLADAVGEIDILVNNAGDVPAGPLDTLSEADWRRGFDLKVFGYILLSRIFYARMKAASGGVIVNVIGNSGENWDASYIAGSTANAAIMSFTKALGGRSLNDGIRVVGINPGPVDTDRMLKIMRRKAIDMLGDENRWKELYSHYPAGRAATAEEVADLVAFLASPRSDYTTGTIVTLDGGIAARGSVI